ncbi:uncharacterized protein RB166_020710 [Leptodactylus fuscus]
MDFWVILALGLVVTCGVEGCSVSPSLSLSLSIHNSLQCRLCLDSKDHFRQNYTFTLTRNGKAVKFSQVVSRRIWHSLDTRKNNSGLWRCHVQEFPDLSAEYYLGPPTVGPPAGEKKDPGATSVPASTMSTRTLLTIMTAALLLALLIIGISFISGVCIVKQHRKKSSARRHHRDGDRSDSFPLTETASSDLSSPRLEADTEVYYVDLEIIRDPYRKPSTSHNTIYANIV